MYSAAKPVVVLLCTLVLGLTTADRSQAKDPLPDADRVKWDLAQLEDNEANFVCLKRTVKDDVIVWLVEVKSDKAAEFLRRLHNNQFERPSRLLVRGTDEDNVQVSKLWFDVSTTDLRTGDKV